MASASNVPPPLELFYSYAHTDEELRRKLEKHLAALQRAQLISGWSDRKILPGTEWAAEIQAAMERAGIILLLISSDFLASEYCYNIELPFALKRHQAGSAIVIPVLLRPVEWKDTPFAILQALPEGARAVTLWPNQDEAFAEIAARLRERIYAQRLTTVKPKPDPISTPPTMAQQRVLDAAVASHIPLGEPADVVTLVRTVTSNGLKTILQLDTSYNIPPENVQSKPFEVEFPRDRNGQVLPAALELVLDSPGCDPPQQRRKLRVPPSGDSDVCVFLLTPLKTGRLMLNLEVRYEDVEVGSRLLVTEAGPSTAVASPYSLVSMPLTSTAAWGTPLPVMTKPFAAPQPPLSLPNMSVNRTTVNLMPADSSPPTPPQPSISKKTGSFPMAVPSAKKSWLTRPMMATMASAAAVVVIGGVLITTGQRSLSPVDNTSASRPQIAVAPPPTQPDSGGTGHAVEAVTVMRPPPQAVAAPARPAANAALAATKSGDYQLAINSLTAAIQQDPKNAELYWRRAEAYQHVGQPELALRDLDQSIQLAPDASYPHLLKGEILSATARHELAIQEYQHAAKAPSASPQVKEFAAKRSKESVVKLAH